MRCGCFVDYCKRDRWSHGKNNCCWPHVCVTGSPLQFFVDAVNTGVVTAYGPGLSYGMVNKAATFTVVTKNAGEGSVPGGSVGCAAPPVGRITV